MNDEIETGTPNPGELPARQKKPLISRFGWGIAKKILDVTGNSGVDGKTLDAKLQKAIENNQPRLPQTPKPDIWEDTLDGIRKYNARRAELTPQPITLEEVYKKIKEVSSITADTVKDFFAQLDQVARDEHIEYTGAIVGSAANIGKEMSGNDVDIVIQRGGPNIYTSTGQDAMDDYQKPKGHRDLIKKVGAKMGLGDDQMQEKPPELSRSGEVVYNGAVVLLPDQGIPIEILRYSQHGTRDDFVTKESKSREPFVIAASGKYD